MPMHAQAFAQPPITCRPMPSEQGQALALRLTGGWRDHPHGNQLLAALPYRLWQRGGALLEPVDLPAGKVLSHAGCKMSHVFFPTTAVSRC